MQAAVAIAAKPENAPVASAESARGIPDLMRLCRRRTAGKRPDAKRAIKRLRRVPGRGWWQPPPAPTGTDQPVPSSRKLFSLDTSTRATTRCTCPRPPQPPQGDPAPSLFKLQASHALPSTAPPASGTSNINSLAAKTCCLQSSRQDVV